MELKDMYDFSLIENEAERLVIEELDRQLTEDEKDDNEDFVLDVATLALNNVKPAYRSTLLGKLYSSALGDTDYSKEVQSAVADALHKIRENPPEA